MHLDHLQVERLKLTSKTLLSAFKNSRPCSSGCLLHVLKRVATRQRLNDSSPLLVHLQDVKHLREASLLLRPRAFFSASPVRQSFRGLIWYVETSPVIAIQLNAASPLQGGMLSLRSAFPRSDVPLTFLLVAYHFSLVLCLHAIVLGNPTSCFHSNLGR